MGWAGWLSGQPAFFISMNDQKKNEVRLSFKPQLDSLTAQKVLIADIANVLKKVKSGKALTKYERDLIEQHAKKNQQTVEQLNLPEETWAKNQVELAAVLGVTRQSIARWMREPNNPGKRSNGNYSISEWKEFARARGAMPTPEGLDKNKLQADRLLLQNRALEYELSVQQRRYRSVDDIEAWGAELGMAIRKVVTQLRRLAPQLAGLSVSECEARLREEEIAILEKMQTIELRVKQARDDVVTNEPSS